MTSLGFIRRHAVLVLAAWVVLIGIGNLLVPQLERVVDDHSAAFFSPGTAAAKAAVRMGHDFGESRSDNITYLVVDSDHRLTQADRAYYMRLVAALRSDTTHVESVLDLWSDPLSAPSAESEDHRAVYALMRLAGDIGDAQAAHSVSSVRDTIAHSAAPPNLRVYVSGPGATIVDEFGTIEHRLAQITLATVVVIALLLLVVYRSVPPCAIVLMTVGCALAAARVAVALLGAHRVIEISTFSDSLMAAMLLGAGTDYAIFLLGRYHEYRRGGMDREASVVASYRATAPVLIASASTVAAALMCLAFTRNGVLRSAAIPCAVAVLFALGAALTVTPALLTLATRRGLVEPRKSKAGRRWRRVGTAVVRWPGPILITATGFLIVCALPALGLRLQYDERLGGPVSSDSNRGYQAADAHFSPNTLLPEYVLIEADHDLRDPAGLIAIERITRQINAIPGVRSVQSASRPAGAPIAGATVTEQAGQIGLQLQSGMQSLQAALDGVQQTQPLLAALASALDRLSAGLAGAVDGLREIHAGAVDTQSSAAQLHDVSVVVSGDLAPLRGFVDATADCPTNPICSMVQKVIDPVDTVVRSTSELSGGTARLTDGSETAGNALAAANAAVTSTRTTLTQLRDVVTSLMHTTGSVTPQLSQLTAYLTEMSHDFAGTGEGGFYVPQRVFDDPRFQRAAHLVFSPDGRATRLVVYPEGSAWGGEAAALTDQIRSAVHEATKEGPLAHNVVSVTGVGAYTSDLRSALAKDMVLVVVVTLALIFAIVLAMVRSPVAAIAIVATVAASYLAALGATVLLWQDIVGSGVHWAVAPLSFVALVAVGADYNLLLIARLRGRYSNWSLDQQTCLKPRARLLVRWVSR